ncbi:MAG: biotin transporter BioY [Lachnospiraceae bacterium]|nr:biotin transporter BioY [Lachnospiraceae bacterium]
MISEKNVSKTLDLVYIAVCAVLTAVCSWISIPAVVPFTLQTFAVFLVLELIGGKRGTISIIVYILMAAVGLPVLSGFAGGPGALVGMTGGYILGFIFIGLIYMLGEKLFGRKLPVRIISMVLGLFICYAFGTAWFMTVYARKTGPIGAGAALSLCVIPFIIPDLLKISLAVMLAHRIRRA